MVAWGLVVGQGGPVAISLPDVPSPPDCLACGACCFSPAEHYVPVTGNDWARLGEAADRWAAWTDNKAFMRMTEGHCAALAVEHGENGTRFVCQIYERRPQTCRDLDRGSPACEAACMTLQNLA